MREAIFLSASIPDPNREPQFARTANSVAITAAVTALMYVTLGRRPLVWGGHPAITPMVWAVAESLEVDYGSWVRLYQTKFFKDEYPEDNLHFKNVIYTRNFQNDRVKSLKEMRKRMFREHDYKAAVFIGGMSGIIEEFELFQRYQPNAAVVPIISTGGAACEVAARMNNSDYDLTKNTDYVSLLHDRMSISIGENRYNTPDIQPQLIKDRLWSQ